MERLDRLEAGTPILVNGDHVVRVSEELAAAFAPGDRVLVVPTTGDLLHVPAAESALVDDAVTGAAEAFAELSTLPDEAVTDFFERFADRLSDPAVVEPIQAANAEDVADAAARGRSTTRLALDDKMLSGMVDGLRGWAAADPARDRLVEALPHQGWHLEQRTAGLGVVGFVFEGRPNVFADATGVLRSGNTVVFRIGRDALRTARAIVQHALEPALRGAGLPRRSVGLIDSAAHAAGWALFAHPRLSLAVARGSGPAVTQLGAVARQAGIPASLHGTGGAWMLAGEAADPERLAAAVEASLDRKVCNTLNVCAVPRARAAELVPFVLDALLAAGERRGTESKLHVTDAAAEWVPADWFTEQVPISRASGPVIEPRAERIDDDDLGVEWEWEDSPELTLAVVDSIDDAVARCNTLSPRLVATVISEDPDEVERGWRALDVPFFGDGFTRWVDGQYALGRPELGLSNWEGGRLFARGGVLSGDSVVTIRTRVRQDDPNLRR